MGKAAGGSGVKAEGSVGKAGESGEGVSGVKAEGSVGKVDGSGEAVKTSGVDGGVDGGATMWEGLGGATVSGRVGGARIIVGTLCEVAGWFARAARNGRPGAGTKANADLDGGEGCIAAGGGGLQKGG